VSLFFLAEVEKAIDLRPIRAVKTYSFPYLFLEEWFDEVDESLDDRRRVHYVDLF
jgi:hypothetical protein